MSRGSKDLPTNGLPNGTQKKVVNEKTIQIRHYGPDGCATKNIDFGHDHSSVGDLTRMTGTGQENAQGRGRVQSSQGSDNAQAN